MKPFLIFLLLLSFSIPSHSQFFKKEKPRSKEVYLKRVKTYNTVGWILLGTGITLLVIEAKNHKPNEFLSGLDYFPGIMVTALSGACFISAGAYKQKARLVSTGLKMEYNQGLMLTDRMRRGFPAVGLKIRL